MELDAAEWCTAPVEKEAGTVENVVAGRWPGGEEGYGERRRWSIVKREDGGQSGTVERRCGHTRARVVESVRWRCHAGACMRRCGHDDSAVNGEEQMTGSRVDKVGDERIRKWRFEPFGWCRGPSMKVSGRANILSTTIPY
jgi:hypothetical protein